MSKWRRRDFLWRATACWGAVSAPLVLSGKTLGLDGGVPANERIVMGMIGQGIQGRVNTTGFLQYPQVQITAVCDTVDDHARRGAALVNQVYGNNDCKTGWRFEEITQSDRFDAVFIGTNEHWHTCIAIDAMKNGKDVYCEKPETLTIREGQLLREAVRRYRRVFCGGSQRVWGDYELFHRILSTGVIGELLIGHADTGGGWSGNPLPGQPIPSGVHWNRWLGPAPVRPYHPAYLTCGCGNGWMDFSGGSLVSWGAHAWGAIMYAMQLDHTGPTRVVPAGIDGAKNLTWEFANGKRIMERNVWGWKSGVRRQQGGPFGCISFTGSEGTLCEQDIIDGLYSIPEGERNVYKGASLGKPIPPSILWYYYPDPKTGMIGHSIHGDFLHCVKTREKPFRDIETVHRVCSLAHLGNIATFLRRKLRFDPVHETILDDGEAARLLDRPRRAPWELDS